MHALPCSQAACCCEEGSVLEAVELGPRNERCTTPPNTCTAQATITCNEWEKDTVLYSPDISGLCYVEVLAGFACHSGAMTLGNVTAMERYKVILLAPARRFDEDSLSSYFLELQS